MSNVVNLVRIKRLTKGYSQENLANAIGKSQYWVSMFENGQKSADADTLLKICQFLCIDSNDIRSENTSESIDNTEEEAILNLVKSFEIISQEIDRLTELKNKIQKKFFDQ